MHGLAIGQLAAMGAFIPFSGSDEVLYGIGWRIPYWIAIPVVLYALWIRTKVDEPPKKTELSAEETIEAEVASIEEGAASSDSVFADTATTQMTSSIAGTKLQQSAKKGTISHLFKNHWPNVIRVILMGQCAITGALMGTYGLNYGSTYWDLDKPRLLTVATLSLFIGQLVQPLWANLSDKIGRHPVYLSSMIGLLIMFPLIFWSLQSKNWYLIFATYLFAGLIMTGGNVVQAALYTELFPKEVRMSGYAISTQIGNIFVGFTPMIIAILVRPGAFGWIPVLIFTTTMMGLGVIACFTTRETSGQSWIKSRCRM